MSKQKGKRGAFLLLACPLLLGLLTGGQGPVVPPGPEKGPLVEVHGPEIAHVPATARYVTYDGVVREIVRFSAALREGEEDCQCPQCCDGYCYVIIYVEFVVPGSPLGGFYYLWLKC